MDLLIRSLSDPMQCGPKIDVGSASEMARSLSYRGRLYCEAQVLQLLSMIDSSEAPQFNPTPATYTIEAVLFDYGQVLSKGPNPEAWERMRTIVHASPSDFHDAYWKPRHDYDRGTLNGTAYWQEVARNSGQTSLTDTQLHALYAADVALWTDLNEPMVTWAKHLHRRGVRTGILSNIGDRMETGICESFDWIGDFHHCTWSHRLNLAKPEMAIYRHAAEGLQTDPGRILFIDDREENIAAAQTAGMAAIHYTNHHNFIQTMKRMGLETLL